MFSLVVLSSLYLAFRLQLTFTVFYFKVSLFYLKLCMSFLETILLQSQLKKNLNTDKLKKQNNGNHFYTLTQIHQVSLSSSLFLYTLAYTLTPLFPVYPKVGQSHQKCAVLMIILSAVQMQQSNMILIKFILQLVPSVCAYYLKSWVHFIGGRDARIKVIPMQCLLNL